LICGLSCIDQQRIDVCWKFSLGQFARTLPLTAYICVSTQCVVGVIGENSLVFGAVALKYLLRTCLHVQFSVLEFRMQEVLVERPPERPQVVRDVSYSFRVKAKVD